ncbi:hypothetical protein ACFQ14_02850 [Pseudahrensia aquimaris]|uniref:DUF3096 domain-containing protein n=1 Tax=Pseudahrensia aquimaris TaxID=744461 RepID=A0ABW3FBV9_9HYPH
MIEVLDFLRSYSPGLLIGAGVALLVVPKWIRVVIALGLIFVGVNELYPDLFGVRLPEGAQT